MSEVASSKAFECYAAGHIHKSKAEAEDCLLLAVGQEVRLRRAKKLVPEDLKAQVVAFRLANKRPAEPAPQRLSVVSPERGESPPEQLLLEAFNGSGFTEFDTEPSAGILYQQYNVQTDELIYRLDFAIIRKLPGHTIRIDVEVDGDAYHRDRALEDRRRDRALARKGWIVMRFMAKEVFADAGACVMDVVYCMSEAVHRLTGGRGT